MKKLVSIAVIAFAFSMVFALTASAQTTTTQVITETDVTRALIGVTPMDQWMLYTRDTGTGTFINGPGTPPAGTGSIQFSTPLGNDKVFLFNYEHIGTKLIDIEAMSYSTYRTAGNLQQVTSLNIQVDFNGPTVAGGFTTLVFEPVYNEEQGEVTTGAWQAWDAYNGGNAKWWSTNAIPGVCAFNCFVTWDAIIAANTEATILGGFGLNQGGGNPNLIASADMLTIAYGGTTIAYNFERDLPPVYTTPTNKNQCKNGGWATFNPPTGPFPNQGQCVAYAVHNN